MDWTGWAGDGAGLVMIGVAWLIGKFQHHLHRFHSDVEPWLNRVRIVLMGMGGLVLVITNIGQWVSSHPLHAIASAGGVGKAIAITATGFVLLTVALGICFGWSKAVIPALILPFLLAIFTGGFFHNLDQQVAPPARQKSSDLSNWLGQVGSSSSKHKAGH